MTISSLFFLDIDGTLLDASYSSNEDRLKAYVWRQEKRGCSFGLNSNRALEDLLPVAEQFGITGPLIGENGLFVYYPQTNEIEYLLNASQLEELAETKTIVEEEILEILKKQFGEHVYWENVDTVKTLSRGDQEMSYADGDIIVFNNKFRKYTVSAHIKRHLGGEFVALSKERADTIAIMIQQRLSNKKSIVAYSPTFGNILMYTNQVSKRTAVEKLMRDRFQGASLYAIGDEMSDYYMIKDIGTFLTVGNAPDVVKQKATKVTKKLYAQGVLELLEDTGVRNG